ncbi:MAG: polyphosphate:AMP phosphotransferase [Lentisphaeraceae bacterium]|nr:polyphosphate:AMP phosphotransferase [Lentisphaeraceae bacterium]
MLKSVNLDKKLSKSKFKEKYVELERELIRLQREILEVGMPVLITFEGWSAAGKGTLINDLSIPMDPRGFKALEGRSTENQLSHLIPFWKNSPAKGFISIFDRSWYRAGIDDIFATGELKKKFIRDAINFEQHHLNSDTLVIKFFLHLSQEEQSKRLTDLTSNEATSWRVTEADFKQNFHYQKFRDACEYVIEKTNKVCPWEIIPSEDHNYARFKVISTVVDRIKKALKSYPSSSADEIELPSLEDEMPLMNIDLSKKLDVDDYKKEYEEISSELKEFGFKLFRQKIPMVIMYEGRDAAGKGGSIRRLTQSLDPRSYNVIPVAAPTKVELSHNYLWRFWTQLPDKGNVTIFDRSWYGRVLVERVEGYCRPDDWKRAYEEINEVEKHLVEQGAIMVKFWLEISQEEQLKRFTRRLEIPHKQWKITDDDWRNRKKWKQYEPTIDEMLVRTNTDWAPWTVIEGNNKHYARIKTMRTVLEQLKKHLN